jgi:hypothetical protein
MFVTNLKWRFGPTGGDGGTGGYMPLAIVKGAASDINWVHSHHNGKPLLITNVTGAIVPYSGHAVLGFPGQFANAVGLAGAQHYYNRYRDYKRECLKRGGRRDFRLQHSSSRSHSYGEP